MTSIEVLTAKCDVLVAENDALRERVLQLEAALKGGFDHLPIGGLTPAESVVLSALMARPMASKEVIFDALYALRIDAAPDPKIVDVYICKLRRKLMAIGVEIRTHWGRGYSLSPDARASLEALREAIR